MNYPQAHHCGDDGALRMAVQALGYGRYKMRTTTKNAGRVEEGKRPFNQFSFELTL